MAQQSKAGSFYLLGVGLFLFLMGAFFCWLMWSSFQKASATRKWEQVNCLVTVSDFYERQVPGSAAEYRWKVQYVYQYGGEHHQSDKYKPRGSKWTREKDTVAELIKEWPKDSKQQCFVNPQNPAEAILDHDTKAAGYSIWFPGLFAIGGIGLMVGAIRGMMR